jgi:hypothetical protein
MIVLAIDDQGLQLLFGLSEQHGWQHRKNSGDYEKAAHGGAPTRQRWVGSLRL